MYIVCVCGGLGGRTEVVWLQKGVRDGPSFISTVCVVFCKLGSANENADVGMHFGEGDEDSVVGGFVSLANGL